jgi:hypothetical protein
VTERRGLELSQAFYSTIVGPVIEEHFPDIYYAAGRIGLGSEVLGFDAEISEDHDYGPCVQIFLPESNFAEVAAKLMVVLDVRLPESFDGHKVRYGYNARPPGHDSRRAGMLGSQHGVEMYTVAGWCERFFQRQIPEKLTARDWLAYPEQMFLTATAGAIFRDDVGEIHALRRRLSYFPTDIWLYKLAAQWDLIAAERAFVGRVGYSGDELGSQIIAARMVENIMRLALLIERRYAPYSKWLGTSFSRLDTASDLTPLLTRVLTSHDWQQREARLVDACSFVAELQLARGIPGATAPTSGNLHGRPFQFIDSLKISAGLRAAIKDEDVRKMPNFGAADQLLKNGAVLFVPALASGAWSGVFERATTFHND